MFETAELGRTVTKAEYDERQGPLRTELLALQARLRTAPFPVLVLVNGVDGGGKGDTVNVLHEWMDPRWLQTFAYGPPVEEERARPPWWRFWRDLPPHGVIGISFGNWYTDPIVQRVHRRIDKDALENQLLRIEAFERALVDDGALIVKLWFHLSKRAQQERFELLLKDKRTRWRVTKQDLENHERYGRFRNVSDRVVRATSTGSAPWTIIEATDRRYRELAVGQTLADALRERLERLERADAAGASVGGDAKKARPAKPRRLTPTNGKTILDTVDLSLRVDDAEYRERLEVLQGRFNSSFRRLKREGRSAIAVFEGWDAAGKGGAIRRVTAALDARDYRVIAIAAPSDEEKAHHYLWRFWRHLPRTGNLTIYDRSWYGRVLVERVEGFARADEWQRAYNEINELEEQLVEHGIVLAKLWLHIDADEQLKRFREREQTTFKQHKITSDDYRNRKKADEYVAAVHDMVERTSTAPAPWHLVAANDKRHARLDVLEHLCTRIEVAL